MRTSFFILFWLCVWSVASRAQMPDLQLRDVRAALVRTDTLVGERPTLLTFFATWCKPCLRELRAFHDNYAQWKAQHNVRIVAVSIDEGQNRFKVAPLVEEEAWDFEVLLDEEGALRRYFKVESVPQLLLFDKKGKLVYRHAGYAEGDEDTLWQRIMGME